MCVCVCVFVSETLGKGMFFFGGVQGLIYARATSVQTAEGWYMSGCQVIMCVQAHVR